MNFSDKLKKLCKTSLILSALMTFIPKIYECLRNGVFGRFFTAYSKEEQLLKNGRLNIFRNKKGKATLWLRQLRQRLAEFAERSIIPSFFTRLFRHLLGCSLRFYGTYFLTYGGYTVLVFLIKYYADIGTASFSALIAGMVMMAFSLPMLASAKSLAELLQKGCISHVLLIDGCGVPPERLDVPGAKGGGRYNLAIVAGMLTGALTFFISPSYMIWALVFVVVIAVVLHYPEVGVMAVLALMPVFSLLDFQTRWLNFAIGLSALGYLGKLIRGKRIIRFSLLDIAVLFFIGVTLLGGIVTIGGSESFVQATNMCTMLLMYFMVVNLMRTPAWLNRAVLTVTASAVIAASVGILGTLFDGSALGMNISGALKTSDTLSAYLILIMPLCLATLFNARTTRSRMVQICCVAIMVLCMVMSSSSFAWLFLAFTLLFFFLIYSKKTLCWLFLGGLTIPAWLPYLPASILKKFSYWGDLTNGYLYQRIFTWKGSARLIGQHIWGGVGYGESAFRNIYPLYSYNGLEQAKSAGSVPLSLFVSMGIVGLLVFLLIILLFTQHCFEYISNALDNYSKNYVTAAFSGVLGVFFMSFFEDIWYNNMVYLAFWVMLALASAYIRAGNLIRSRLSDVVVSDSGRADVDLNFES